MKLILYHMQHRPMAVLFLLFFITVFLRIPQLTRPLSKHHELNTAAVLTSIQVWNDSGISFSHGSPVHKFPGTHNIFKIPNNPYPNLFNSGTYLSVGPFSYILPWALFKILHIPPSEKALRIFMLLLELLSVFLFYFLVKKVFASLKYLNQKSDNSISLNTPYYHFIAVAFFIVSPVIMWFIGNAYCHEILVLPLYLGALIMAYNIIENNYSWNSKNYILYGFIVAVSVYTDWLGCVLAFVFFIQAFTIKNLKQRIPFLLVNAAAVSIPLILIIWQYTSVVGVAEYQKFFAEQLFHRRTPDGEITYSSIDFIKYFITGYGLFFISAITAIVWRRVKWNRYLALLFIIPLIHYFLFRSFSNEHDYSVLKWAPIVIIWSIIFLFQIKKNGQQFTIVITVCFALFLYEYINPPGTKSLKGEDYGYMKGIGKTITENASTDEYIFINTPSYYYQIGWYAKRNYLNVTNEAEARNWLQNQTGQFGIYIEINEDFTPFKILHFTKK